MKYSDPVSAVEQPLEWIFRILFPNASARAYFGLSGISQHLAGTGWYLWFTGVKGAYLIELADADLCTADYWKRVREEDNRIYCGTYRLKYFPHPNEDVFESYSLIEKNLRSGAFFDETGTPRSDSWDECHESLYSIGFMDLVTDGRRSFLALCFRSPDRWITMVEEETDVKPETESQPSAFLPMRIDRCLETWQLIWPLLDTLICAASYVYETFPAFAAVLEGTGCVYSIHRDQRVTEQAREDITARTLIALLQTEKDRFAGGGTARFPLVEYLTAIHRRGDSKVPSLVHLQKNMPQELIPWINPKWWCAKNFDISQEDAEFIG